jgi:ribonuclease BN (tRNA processing enzyme)
MKCPAEVYRPSTREYKGLPDIEFDIKTRTEGLEHSNITGYKVNVHEIQPGVVYRDPNVIVRAFAVHHGDVPAYGYRFETADRTIVISGDASPDGAVLQNCNRCDVLIHEVYTQTSFAKVSVEWKKYRLAYHTSSEELAELATKAKPGLLILYHRANPGCDQARTEECREAGSEEQLLKEVRQAYSGKVVVAGHDLDVY